jgi:hypothetical protein
VALVESASDHVFSAHGQVQVTASKLHNLIDQLIEDPPTSPVELTAVENLVEHDHASGNLHVAHAGAFRVSLVCDHDSILVNALTRLDVPLQSVLSNVREYIAVRLKMPAYRSEIAQTRVTHDYFFLKTKIGSVLKALFPICFSPHILLI